jgi:hypothetical protein
MEPMMKTETPAPRLTLRADLATAEGEPRICIAWPGRTVPVAFATVAAALAALRNMEGRDAGR